MRVVVDTNVLVSAVLRAGSIPQQALEQVVAGRCTWLVDSRIEAEYRQVLRRPFLAPMADEVEAILRLVERRATWVHAAPLPLTLPDESDRPFIEVAAAGGADAIITGNAKHFKPREGRLSIRILSPRRFLESLGRERL